MWRWSEPAGLTGRGGGAELPPRSAPFLCWLPHHVLSLGFSPFLTPIPNPPPSPVLETARCPGGRKDPQGGACGGELSGYEFSLPLDPSQHTEAFLLNL